MCRPTSMNGVGKKIQQDSRAIQYTSEVVNYTVLKYIKSVINCFSWGAPHHPGWVPAPGPVFLPMHSPTNS